MHSVKTHKAMAQALRATKNKLWDGYGYPTKNTYICIALESTKAAPTIINKTQQWILSVLDGELSLKAYMKNKHGKSYSQLKMQTVRQEFIDHLIGILES